MELEDVTYDIPLNRKNKIQKSKKYNLFTQLIWQHYKNYYILLFFYKCLKNNRYFLALKNYIFDIWIIDYRFPSLVEVLICGFPRISFDFALICSPLVDLPGSSLDSDLVCSPLVDLLGSSLDPALVCSPLVDSPGSSLDPA